MTAAARALFLVSAATILATATAVSSQSPAQEPPHPEPAAATLDALLNAPAGIYTVTDGGLERAGDEAAAPVLLQADAYPGTGGRVQVPVSISSEVLQNWTMRLRIARTGTVGARRGEVHSMSGSAGRVRTIREFLLEPGQYEAAAVLLRRGADSGSWIASVGRQPVVVPDLAAPRLAVGPVVLGDAVAAAGPEERGRPFVFGPTRLTPAISNRFRQADDLHVAFRIYKWKADDKAKPDLAIEFVFYQQMGSHLRFFNKLKQQAINVATLPSTFDGASRVVAAGMSVPLGSFPPGEFELTVRIRDVRGQASVAQKVRFFVVA